MSKLQVVICNTCNTPFAAHVEKYIDEKWLKSCAKYIKHGNSRLESVDSVSFEGDLNACCGNTKKHKDN